jgi:hypothetical protein
MRLKDFFRWLLRMRLTCTPCEYCGSTAGGYTLWSWEMVDGKRVRETLHLCDVCTERYLYGYPEEEMEEEIV